MARTPTISETTEALVRNLYGAMAEHIGLDHCLDLLAPVFESHVTGLHTEDFGDHRSTLLIRGGLSSREFSALTQEYSERWSGSNPWIERSLAGYLSQGYESTDDVVSDAELIATPYYKHYLRHFDVRHGLGICLWTDRRDSYVVAAFNHSRSAGPITAVQKQLARALQPHLVNLYAIYRKLARLEEANGSLRMCFDRLSIGMLLLDTEARVLAVNAKAQTFLNGSPALLLTRGGTLRASDPAVNERLRSAVFRLACGNGTVRPQAISLGGSNTGAPSVMHLCATPVSASHTFVRNGRIIAFLCDAGVQSDPQQVCAMLQGALGLTATQARVAWLLRERRSPEQIASALGVSITTVRTHLKHLFRSTLTRRQSELVQLIERIISTAPL